MFKLTKDQADTIVGCYNYIVDSEYHIEHLHDALSILPPAAHHMFKVHGRIEIRVPSELWCEGYGEDFGNGIIQIEYESRYIKGLPRNMLPDIYELADWRQIGDWKPDFKKFHDRQVVKLWKYNKRWEELSSPKLYERFGDLVHITDKNREVWHD